MISSEGVTYERVWNGSAWTAWKQYAFTDSTVDNANKLGGESLGNIRIPGYAMQMTTIDASSLDQNTWYPVESTAFCPTT